MPKPPRTVVGKLWEVVGKLWEEMLASAGVLYCPVSGAPVMDLGTATDTVQSAIWEVLNAISGALNGRDGGVEAALNGLRDAMAATAEA